MSILLILFLLFGFVFAGFGTGTSHTSDLRVPAQKCAKHSSSATRQPDRCRPPAKR